jgi:hypothetical protein
MTVQPMTAQTADAIVPTHWYNVLSDLTGVEDAARLRRTRPQGDEQPTAGGITPQIPGAPLRCAGHGSGATAEHPRPDLLMPHHSWRVAPFPALADHGPEQRMSALRGRARAVEGRSTMTNADKCRALTRFKIDRPRGRPRLRPLHPPSTRSSP